MFFKSLKNALKGIIYCINSERNFRVHTVAALYVLVFSRVFDFSQIQYAVLFFTISAVMTTECINTAMEKILDFTQENYNPVIKLAKDIAAGSVLISAIASVFIGINLFWDIEKWIYIFNILKNNIEVQLIFLLSALLSVIYINGVNGKLIKGIQRFIVRKKERNAL